MTASTAPKSARRKSRELAFQGIYEWLLAGSDAGAIEAFLHERYPTIKLDDDHFQSLLHGALAEAGALDGLIQPHIDRQTSELSPVEHALLLMGAFELQRHLDVPYRVVINEAVELGKVYGGTDGYKYVNGVLDRIAADVRKSEVEAVNLSHPQEPSAADLSPPTNPYANVPVSHKARAPAQRKGASFPRRASASPRPPRKD
ncbi:MAG: transcription antitermination factor NusB [Thiomonas sp.]|uniref:transcription antitermination factor NusB n=1 Tax=Thiomonas sp. TaxID=2047785 RepID=UPI002A3609F1|nr:transcription antitermination factor NusB [Thiomonas sp.]MDY0329596.1 transcription antitermination factor NusB [Thiomonas sp.]